jgi:mono/diheme cytochrome c family protein
VHESDELTPQQQSLLKALTVGLAVLVLLLGMAISAKHRTSPDSPGSTPGTDGTQATATEPHVSAESGAKLFASYCGSCHGADGTNPPVQGVPTLNHPRMLAVASDEYYRNIISHGRSGTSMIPWENTLSEPQILSIVEFIRSWYPDEPDRSNVTAAAGNARYGAALYRGNCAGCHGLFGKGGIGNSLRSPSFLAMASESFLRDTIVRGRGRGATAMPAGHHFSEAELSDLLAFLGTWSEPKHDWAQVQTLRRSAGKQNEKFGAKIFRSRCASCHGEDGEGSIGSRLNSDSFLSMVDDQFLYRSITEGRPGTAMPRWWHLKSEDVADLITFIRTWQTEPARTPTARKPGDSAAGLETYQQFCVSCHGQEGQGGVGGQIANPTFLSCASDGFLWDTIANGKQGTAMKGFLKGTPGAALVELKPNDIDNLVAYLRELQDTPKVDALPRLRSKRAYAIGKALYQGEASCHTCHGKNGEGASGPALGNPAFLKTASDGFLIGTIMLGREGTPMLNYHKGGNVELSADDVESVVTYLRSLENAPFMGRRRVASSPANVTEGKTLFSMFCAACHGSEGKGLTGNRINGSAPSLNNPEFLAAANDGLLLATIALGRPGTAMRPFAKHEGGVADLEADEILKILAFIRSWESAQQK